jgi:hypothetical protein
MMPCLAGTPYSWSPLSRQTPVVSKLLMRLILFLALLAAGNLVVGCGRDDHAPPGPRLSHDQYLQKMRELEAGVDARSASRLFFELVTEPGLPKETCLARARDFDRNLHDIVDKFAALRPPGPVQSLQNRFVSAARRSIETVDDAVRDVQHGSLECGLPMNRRVYGLSSTMRAEQVLQEFRKKGYRIGANSD